MDKLAESFAKLAEQYSPKVVDAALAAARTEAYSVLASRYQLWLNAWALSQGVVR